MTEACDTDMRPPRGRGAARIRSCAVTRAAQPEASLIRFVAAPDGSVVADLKAKLPGRGVWVGLGRAVVGEAVRRNVFARSLKQAVKPSADLADQVALRLRETALGRLGLARKAGAVAAGFSKTESAIAGGDLVALIIAADAADDGRRKIEAALRRGAQHLTLPVLRRFTAAELGLALGRAGVIHAAVLQSPAGRSFLEAADRLQRYEGIGPGSTPARADLPRDVTDE